MHKSGDLLSESKVRLIYNQLKRYYDLVALACQNATLNSF